MRKISLAIIFLILAQKTFSAEVTVSVTIREMVQKEIPPQTTDTFLVQVATGTPREIVLEIPAGTFVSTATITIERRTDFPSPDQIKQPNFKGTGVGVEITLSTSVELNQSVNPVRKEFSNGVKITLSYRPIIFTNEENLTLARFEEGENTWQPLLSNIDKMNKKISATVTKFSQFQIVEKVASPNLDNVFVYPNPCYLNREKKINFARLPAYAEITVYTLSGEKVYSATAGDTGYYIWTPENLASGIYIFLVKDSQSGKKKTGKFAIIR